jgi:hypothetical protein
MKSTMKFPVRTIMAVLLAVVMLLGVSVVKPVEAISVGPIPVLKHGSEVTAKINILGSTVAQVPDQVMDILDNLTLHIKQMSDKEGETPYDYFSLALAREGDPAVTVSALMSEDGSVVVDIPELFDTTITLKVDELIKELFGQMLSQEGFPSLATLQELDVTSFMHTLTGVGQVLSENVPEGVAGTAETFKVENLSAELVPTTHTYESADLQKLTTDVLEFLKTDPGFGQIYELIIAPMNAQDENIAGKTVAEFIDKIKEDAVNNFANKSIVAVILADAEGITRGFDVKLQTEGESDTEIVAISLAEDNVTETELKIMSPNAEMSRVLLVSNYDAEANAYSGTMSVKMHASSEPGAPTKDLIVGTFDKLSSVPFGASLITLGDVSLTIEPGAPMDPITLLYSMEGVDGDDGHYQGSFALKDVAEVALDVKEIKADGVEIPVQALTSKETKEIASMNDLQTLVTPEVQQRLLKVLEALGFSFEMPPSTTTP